MATIRFSNGVTVNFNGTPTQKDIEEVAKKFSSANSQQSIRSQEVPAQENKGFFRRVAEDTIKTISKPLVTAGRTIQAVGNLGAYGMAKVAGDDQAAQRILAQNPAASGAKSSVNLPLVGEIKPISSMKEAIGTGLELGSMLIGGGGTGAIIKQGGKQLVKNLAIQGLKSGAYAGAASGIGSGMQQEDATLGSTLKSGAFGAAIGGSLGSILGGVTGVMSKKTSQAIDDAVYSKFSKAVKPSTSGIKKLGQLEKYQDDALNAVKTIAKNKQTLKFSRDGVEVTGELPSSLAELSQAIDQTKKVIFNQYDDLAKQAGKKGIEVNLKDVSSSLDEVIKSPSLQLSSPEAVKYAQSLKDLFSVRGKIGVVDAQNFIQQRNAALNSFLRNPTYDATSRASVDALIINKMRKTLDDLVSSSTGGQYQILKTQYGSLKAIEKDVIRRVVKTASKDTKGMMDFTDMISGGNLVESLVSLDPSLFAKGAAQKGIIAVYKKMNDPNRMIKSLFETVNKSSAITSSGKKAITLLPGKAAGKGISAQRELVESTIPSTTEGTINNLDDVGRLFGGVKRQELVTDPIKREGAWELMFKKLKGKLPSNADRVKFKSMGDVEQVGSIETMLADWKSGAIAKTKNIKLPRKIK